MSARELRPEPLPDVPDVPALVLALPPERVARLGDSALGCSLALYRRRLERMSQYCKFNAAIARA